MLMDMVNCIPIFLSPVGMFVNAFSSNKIKNRRDFTREIRGRPRSNVILLIRFFIVSRRRVRAFEISCWNWVGGIRVGRDLGGGIDHVFGILQIIFRLQYHERRFSYGICWGIRIWI